MTARTLWLAAACLGFLGVALGAFGAHALKERLIAAGRTETFELAVRYLTYHALALFAIGFLADRWPGAAVPVAGLLQLAGVLLFSSSLLLLALFEWRGLALVTPIGGVLMLAGWALLIYTVASGKQKS